MAVTNRVHKTLSCFVPKRLKSIIALFSTLQKGGNDVSQVSEVDYDCNLHLVTQNYFFLSNKVDRKD